MKLLKSFRMNEIGNTELNLKATLDSEIIVALQPCNQFFQKEHRHSCCNPLPPPFMNFLIKNEK